MFHSVVKTIYSGAPSKRFIRLSCLELSANYSSKVCTSFSCHRRFHCNHHHSSEPYPSALFKIWLTLRTRSMIFASSEPGSWCYGLMSGSLRMAQSIYENASTCEIPCYGKTASRPAIGDEHDVSVPQSTRSQKK